MWLLHTTDFTLEEFNGEDIRKTKYATLSHTWLRKGKGRELSFDHVDQLTKFPVNHNAEYSLGIRKVKTCCEKALAEGFEYVWADTCCIDKRSSAELSEAINSMFTWYAGADVCIVYLEDFKSPKDKKLLDVEKFRGCRWFQRGWTLQELIASRKLMFFDQDWQLIEFLSSDADRLLRLSAITGIGLRVLKNPQNISQCAAARRMSWAARRKTSRPEDTAYCLIGLFGVSMPILYGEGAQAAFRRLQLEYMAKNFDHSLFAWYTETAETRTTGLLASSPADFIRTGHIKAAMLTFGRLVPCYMTQLGISIRLLVRQNSSTEFLGILYCCGKDYTETQKTKYGVGIYLKEVDYSRPETRVFQRIRSNELVDPVSSTDGCELMEMYVEERSSSFVQPMWNNRGGGTA